jgi:hypothetical protein
MSFSNATTQAELALYGVSGSLALLATVLSAHLMLRHLAHWSDARAQLSIVRIVMMIPVYALMSWLAILFGQYAIYFNLIRDAYESLVLYEFFCLLQHHFMQAAPDYFGVADAGYTLADFLRQYEATPWPFPLCQLPLLVPDHRFFAVVRGCLMQYVLLKPVLSFMAVLLSIRGQYQAGHFALQDGFLWIALVSNLSICLALYMLVVFFTLIARAVAPRGALWQFLSIKILIFFIFWQSLGISVLYFFELAPLIGGWDALRSQVTLENTLICGEMLALSIAHLWIYSAEPYRPEQHLLDDLSPSATTPLHHAADAEDDAGGAQ